MKNEMILADAGVPMIFVQWPLMFMALLPVIAVEGWILHRRLALPLGRAIKGSTYANLVSTIVGVPIAWAVMLGVEFVLMSGIMPFAERYQWNLSSPLWGVLSIFASAWVSPPVQSYSGIALAAAVLLVPSYFLSVWIERRICQRVFKSLERGTVARTVRAANLWSYGLLFLLALGWYGYQEAWGMEKAPPMPRTVQTPVVGLRYLHEITLPTDGVKVTNDQFRSAVAKLEADLAEFDGVMQKVTNGKVAVYRNLDRGAWESFAEKDGRWISVDYAGKSGPVTEFQIHEKTRVHPDFGIATFGSAGFLSEARIPGYTFKVDEAGRLQRLTPEYAP